jgi:CheY-like chemotaxis protein
VAKILIVDDEEAILMMYSDRLKSGGNEVITASNGEEGIEVTKKEKPDLIFLDIIMPKINGLDVLKELKADPDTKNIPIFLLTNLPEDASGGKAKELGVTGYLVKAQVEPARLEEIVEETVKK